MAHPEQGNPPASQTRTTTFFFDIGNTNDVCDEKVFVFPVPNADKEDITNDPKAPKDENGQFLRSGLAKFEGFKEAADGGFTSCAEGLGLPCLVFDLEDESFFGSGERDPKRVFLDVTTGENPLGCDFKGFSMTIEIRDIGLFCLTCCDSHDELPAEPPTPLNGTLEIFAAESSATGTGTIYGWVSTKNPITNKDVGALARVGAKKLGTCVTNGPDNTDTFDKSGCSTDELSTPGLDEDGCWRSQKGCFAFRNVPFGHYIINVVSPDFFLKVEEVEVNSSTPVEVNFCDSEPCPSNSACKP